MKFNSIFFQEKSYYALAAFCENMGEEILPFLDSLMGKLFAALQTSQRMLQETCMVKTQSLCNYIVNDLNLITLMTF